MLSFLAGVCYRDYKILDWKKMEDDLNADPQNIRGFNLKFT